MKKRILTVITFVFVAIIYLSLATPVNAAGRPTYANNEGGYISCTVDNAADFKEASTITWGTKNGKKCDEIVIKDGSTITINEQIDITGKLLDIGDEEGTAPTKLQITTGGKLIFNKDEEDFGGIIIGDAGTIEIISGGLAEGNISIFGQGINNTGKVIVTGANSKLYIHDNTEEQGIFNLNVEANNQGTIEVTEMKTGIQVDENNSLTINGGNVIVTKNNGYGILGNVVSNGGTITANENNYGLRLKSNSIIGGNTTLIATNNTTGDIALNDKAEAEVTITDNANVTIGKIVNFNNNNKTVLVIDGDNTNLSYETSQENLVKSINGTVTTNNETIRYADHDIVIDETTIVENTSNGTIKIRTNDMKENTGKTLEPNAKKTITVSTVVVEGKNYKIIDGAAVEDLNISSEETISINTQNGKDDVPKTGNSLPIALIGIIALLSVIGAFNLKLAFNRK